MLKSKEPWTEGRIRAFITSTLRAGMQRWPAKWEALESACVGSLVNPTTGRKAKFYKCAMCGNLFVAKDVQVDHVSPCVDPIEGFTTWDNFIKRLFCEASNLQVLDKVCHKIKSKQEAGFRAETRKNMESQKKASVKQTSLRHPSTGPSGPLKNSAKTTSSKSGKNSRVTRKRTSDE